jgi:poly-gamma-glutamate capsule biosynthesis protein CapA/YwtB (metallophosphatase superfamily)
VTRSLVLLLALLVVVAATAAGFSAVSDEVPSAAPAVAVEQPRQAGRGPLGSGRRVVFAFGGDVHFEGVLATKLAASPETVLDPIEPVLNDADLAMVNLETAVTGAGLAAAKTFTFRAPASAFAALRGGSVDVVSMANNHGMDFGEKGLRDSLAAAHRYRFPVVGIGIDGRRAYAPYRRTIKGQRIAVLGATQVLDDHLVSAWTAGPNKPGLASAKDVPRLLQAVRQARRSSDTVVVYLHWGIELERCPSNDQLTLARQLIGAGADIVVGGHAHRQQGAGRLGQTFVAYGLGNFVWYGTSELSTRTGVLFVTATGRRIDGYRWVPAQIRDGVPRPLTGTARRSDVSAWHTLRDCTGLRR